MQWLEMVCTRECISGSDVYNYCEKHEREEEVGEEEEEDENETEEEKVKRNPDDYKRNSDAQMDSVEKKDSKVADANKKKEEENPETKTQQQRNKMDPAAPKKVSKEFTELFSFFFHSLFYLLLAQLIIFLL